jgi:metal-responsive CopG/Arc/MetJ family transcriptional regulator
MYDIAPPLTLQAMKMPTISVRIPSDTSARLEQAAKSTHRSRSFLVKEALERHLGEIIHEQGGGKTRLEKLRALKGSGARQYGSLTADQIEADIREFRGDE